MKLSLPIVLVSALAASCSGREESASVKGDGPTHRHSAMVQLFNWRFADIQKEIPRLARLGYSHVHVSPAQKSNPSTEWWARYQPVDFTRIEGPLGSESDFRSMNAMADKYGIGIVADVVFNHMANDGVHSKELKYPRFSPQDFHWKTCIDYGNNHSVQNGWLNCDLPDLKTQSEYVRGEARRYLRWLLSMGVDGFRFDAAKHIEPEFFAAVTWDLPPHVFLLGEVISASAADLHPWLGSMDLYDFPLTSTMVQAFSYGGDLRSMFFAADRGQALTGTKAVTFVKNHDTAHAQFGGFSFSSQADEILAYGFILAREEGLPYVYVDAYEDPRVVAGLAFHNRMLGQAEFWHSNHLKDQLVIQRGTAGLAVINKSAEEFAVGDVKATLADGLYRDLVSRKRVQVQDGRLAERIPGRSMAFFVRE